MAETVIDASALLALLNREPGFDVVARALRGGIISTVNLSEVVAKLYDAGIPEDAIRWALYPLGIEIVPFDKEQAYGAGRLRASTQKAGLSFGDRACLNLAKALGLGVLTADSSWAKLSIGVTVRVIR